MSESMKEIFGDNIYSYTRAMAIADGVLIDISDFAKEAGFKIPVAVTETMYNKVLKPTDECVKQGQSLEGRMWDMLMVIRFNCVNSNTSILKLKMDVQYDIETQTENFKAVIGPGDTPEPVLTIMLPYED